MTKLLSAALLFVIVTALPAEAWGGPLSCRFKDFKMSGVDHIRIEEDMLIINRELEIPLEKSRVRCGHFGRQTRFDGSALGFQVVLKTCTSDAKLEGHLIDSVNVVAADVVCNPI